jgi:transposase
MKKFDHYIGIDVSKLTLDVTVLSKTKEDKTEFIGYQVIDNSEESILSFLKKLFGDRMRMENTLFCFEDTGIYSMPLACVLSSLQANFWQVSALEIRRSRGICRGKSDRTDSKAIALYALSNLHKLRLSKVSATAIRQLKLLFAGREKILKSLNSFERTSETGDFCPEEVFRTVKNINETIVNQLKSALKEVEDKMMEIIGEDRKLSRQLEPVTSVRGVGKFTAIHLIVSTKGFEKFENWRQLACFAGVAPFEHTSGTSIRGQTRVSPLADLKLKSLLNMCALVAVRHDAELKAYYERKVAEGKSKMLVINNVRCKLLARVFAVINRNSPYINTRKFAA